MRENNRWLCNPVLRARLWVRAAGLLQQNRLFERDSSPGGLNVEVHDICLK
jgi:hypothetical protein